MKRFLKVHASTCVHTLQIFEGDEDDHNNIVEMSGDNIEKLVNSALLQLNTPLKVPVKCDIQDLVDCADAYNESPGYWMIYQIKLDGGRHCSLP